MKNRILFNTAGSATVSGAKPRTGAVVPPGKPAGTPVPSTPPAAENVAAGAEGAQAGAAPVKRGGGLTREAFDFKTAVKADGTAAWVEKDGNVLLTSYPANFQANKFKALEKENFTPDQEGEASYFDYKAAVTTGMIATYQKALADYQAQAANIRKYGNSDQRRLATKASTMINEFQQLIDQMRKEGVDTSDLERMLAASAQPKAA